MGVYVSGTLSDGITSSVTTISVANAANFPTGSTLQIGSEQMKVTSSSGSTLTVTRGYNGTAAAAHATGASLSGGITINIPPTSGTYSGQAGFCEVIITMQQSRYFSSIFGNGNLTVSARAVAQGTQTQPGIGLLVLNPSHSNSLNVSATGNVNVSNGRVVVDSSDAAGLHLSATGNVTGTAVQTATTSNPGYSATASGTVSPTPVHGSGYYVGDPLAAFAAANTPTTSGLVFQGGFTAGKLPQAGGSALIGSQNGPTGWNIPSGYYSSNFSITDNNFYNPITG